MGARSTAALSLGLLAGLAVAPAWADDARDCRNLSFRPVEVTVPACTRLIETGGLGAQDLALALRRRADAYYFARLDPGVRDAEWPELLVRALDDLDRAAALAEIDAAPADPPFVLGMLPMARADVLFALERYDEAAEAYAEAAGLSPASTGPRSGRAWALAAAGRPGEALAELDALVRDHPADAGWLFHRGRMREGMGDLEAALADFRAVLDAVPDHAGAAQALERLAAEDVR